MADDVSGGANAAVATEETPTTGQDIQQQGEVWTHEALRGVFAEAVQAELPRIVQQALDRMQPQVDQRLTELEKSRGMIEEVASMTKRQQTAIRAIVAGNVAAGNMDESALTEFDSGLAAANAENAAREKAKADTAIAQKDAELEAVKKGQLTPEQLQEIRKGDAWANTERHLDREAKRQGFAGWKTVEAAARKAAGNAISTTSDRFGFEAWEERAFKSISEQAAERDNEGNAPTETPNIRGGASSSAEAIWERYGREGNWSPEVERAGKQLNYI